MRFRPCIDLRNGQVVQIVGGTLNDNDPDGTTVNFESERSSSDFAQQYQKDVLTGGHVIALGRGNKDAALAALKAYPGGLQMGGGVNPDNAQEFLDAGASHVIVTSYVFRDGQVDYERLKSLVEVVGKERLVLDLSCRKQTIDGKEAYWVVTDRWQKFTNLPVNPETLNELATYCDEFLVHGVDVEGKQSGIEEELVALLGEHSPLPVTYAGGVRAFDDLEKVKRLGKGRVDLTIGSALDIFGGEVPYANVVAWQRQEENSPNHH